MPPGKQPYRSLAIKHAKTRRFRKPPGDWSREARRNYLFEVRLIQAGGDVSLASKIWHSEGVGIEGHRPKTPDSCRTVFKSVIGTTGIRRIKRTVVKQAVLRLLEKHSWDQSKAAGELGVKPTDFNKKLKSLGVSDYVFQKKSGKPREGKLTSETILEALEQNNWRQNRAARELRMNSSQLNRLLKKFGLQELVRERKEQQKGN